jgi:hypothetical protein
MSKIKLDDYTIYKSKFLEFAYQHDKPKDWFIIISKYLEFSWELWSKKYRDCFDFSCGIHWHTEESKHTLIFSINLLWLCIEISIGHIFSYPFEEYMK